jgi:HAE1 family hydrophobic/amphiphilic exporter-1
MRPLIRYSLKQVVFMNLAFVILIVAGAMSLLTMPVENMPPVDIGKVFIGTVYYGASAEDVEDMVTSRIEEAIDGLENVEYVQSKSFRNYSSIEVKFIDDSDYETLYDDLRFRILNVQKDLPLEADEPMFFYIDTQFWMPVIIINIAGDVPNRTLTLLAEELKRNVLSVGGVKEVNLRGEHVKEFHVSLDPEKLRRYGISFQQAARAVESANVKIPTGRFRSGGAGYMLDAGEKLSRQEDVLNVIVRRDGDGTFVRVRDLVVSARMSHRDPWIISTVDGMDALSLIVTKEANANALDIMEEIKGISHVFGKAHKADGIIVKLTNDSTIEIEDSVSTLGWNLIIGMTLVTCVLWITLGFRNAMLAAIGIPFSFLCTVLFLKLSGQSINTISLFSFVLISGIIVDDAIVILENTFRHMQMGKSVREAVIDGAGEVALPVTSSAVTTILAFLPLLIMTGSTGDFFSVIPVTVSFALFASLIEALLILPVHIFDWGPRHMETGVTDEAGERELARHLSEGMFAPVWKVYFRVLSKLLENRKKAFAGLAGAFVLAALIFGLSMSGVLPLMNIQFFPGSYFRYHVAMKLPPGSSIETTDSVVRDLSRYVSSFGEREALAVRGDAGFFEAENYVWHRGQHYGQLVVTLPEERHREFPDNPGNDPYVYLDMVRQRLNDYIIQNYHEGSDRIPVLEIFAENTGPPTGEPVNIRVTGDSREMVSKAAEDMLMYLRSDEKFSDLRELAANRAEHQRVVRYLPDLEAAYERGISPAAVTALVAGALNGRRAGKFKAGDEEVDLLVRLARADDEGNTAGVGISRPSDVLDVPAVEHSVAPVYLRDLVKMRYVTEPSVRSRYNGKPALTITADILTGSRLTPARVTNLVSKYARGMTDRFPGVTVAFGGEFDTTKRTYNSLGIALIIAVLCIYMVLATQFKDYLHPLIIISAIVFAFVGVVFGVFITRSTFTIGSAMAVVGLAGVAVNDSLILIDFINVRRRAGMTIREAVIRAASTRMRPVLITTFTTIFGLLPMAIGIPYKSIAWAPMATAFVTGLCSATTLALLMIPVEYELAEAFREKVKRRGGWIRERYGPVLDELSEGMRRRAGGLGGGLLQRARQMVIMIWDRIQERVRKDGQ